MKAVLSGMPECKLGLNDKLVLDKDGGSRPAAAAAGSAKGGKKASGVELDDVQFHRCVQLGKFDADRTITFVPPDGEFELMRYRITDNVNLPFRVIPVIEEQVGPCRYAVNLVPCWYAVQKNWHSRDRWRARIGSNHVIARYPPFDLRERLVL